MFRRTFAIAAAAATAVLVPGAASAAPDAAPAKNTFWADYSVSGQVTLPDGRQAHFSLAEHRDANRYGWTASLGLSTWTYRACGPMQCMEDVRTGSAILDADDVHFSRNLSEAWVTDVPVMLHAMTGGGPGGPAFTEATEVRVSIRFDGTGSVSRDVHHGDLCSDGQTPCQAKRIQADRAAEGALTVGDQSVRTSARISYVQSNETAPKPRGDEGPPPPPVDGEYPSPPPVDGEYPSPPPVGEYPYLPPAG